MNNGQKLREILRQKRMRTSTLARKTGICATTLYSIIERNSSIRYDYALLISEALDIDINEICDKVPAVGNTSKTEIHERPERHYNPDIRFLTEAYMSMDSDSRECLVKYAKMLLGK